MIFVCGRSQSNLDVVLEAAQTCGYAARAVKMIATRYALPQQRKRFYIVGVKSNMEGAAVSTDTVFERMTNILVNLNMKPEPLVDWVGMRAK